METDPQTISAYLVYLSQHAPVEEQGQHNDLALVRGPVVGAEGLHEGDLACLRTVVACCTSRMSGLGACESDNCMFAFLCTCWKVTCGFDFIS